MFAYEPPLNPPCDEWEEYEKPAFILETIKEICTNIAKKGEKTSFQSIFDLLYEHIDDNIEKFLPEADYDDYI